MRWRPEGWKKPVIASSGLRSGKMQSLIGQTYEAGADAMLEALRKQPRVKYQNYAIPNPNFPFPATYYLIPDDEAE